MVPSLGPPQEGAGLILDESLEAVCELVPGRDARCCTFDSAPTGWRFPRPQLSPLIATEAFQAAPLTPVVSGPVGRIVGERGGRQSTLPCIQSAHNSQGHNSHKPRLFITGIGMAAYIQWRHIPKRSHHINKVVYHVKSAFSPRSRSPVHSQRP